MKFGENRFFVGLPVFCTFSGKNDDLYHIKPDDYASIEGSDNAVRLHPTICPINRFSGASARNLISDSESTCQTTSILIFSGYVHKWS